MKVLPHPPSFDDLLNAYNKLQSSSKDQLACAELVLWAQWTRFDPRLGEIWISWLLVNWQHVSSIEFNTAILSPSVIWPHTLGVLLDMAEFLLPRKHRRLFRAWKNTALCNVKPLQHRTHELYFIGLAPLGSASALRQAEIPLQHYARWGYLGDELLVNKAARWKGRCTLVGEKVRRHVLEQLIQNEKRVTTQRYIDALGGWVSKRQAQLDIAALVGRKLRAIGNTKGRHYSRKHG